MKFYPVYQTLIVRAIQRAVVFRIEVRGIDGGHTGDDGIPCARQFDADALVRSLPSSPALQTFGQDALLEAIDKRLETPAEQRRFAEALRGKPRGTGRHDEARRA